MEVTITKQHCEGANYNNMTDCPLARAIREQHPEFPLYIVTMEFVDNAWGG